MENTEFFESLSDSYATKRVFPKLSAPHTVAVIFLGVFAGILGGHVWAKRLNLSDALSSKLSDSGDGPFVPTARVVLSGQDRPIKVLGETIPYASVTLYAKVSGYLGDIYVDKGQKVKKGQLLATIFSPETTSQFAAALADERNKRTRAGRVKALFSRGDATDEERDQAVASADMAAAKLEEQGALKGYTTVVAPFDGRVTARFADPGALVQDAANARSGALPIVTVSQTDRLRITSYVNQDDAPFVREGDPAAIAVPKKSGAFYDAVVTRKSGELDNRSRTMLTEIELDNRNEEIVPGGFVDVTILVKMPQTLQVPAQALVMRLNAPFVAVVDKDSKVRYRAISIGENDGAMVNVLSGLEEDEVVVLNMGNRLAEGQRVQMDSMVE